MSSELLSLGGLWHALHCAAQVWVAPLELMDPHGFRSRALHEGERYGKDPFVFLRELAQNSRDAGASRIDVGLRESGDTIELEISDDGCGMSFEDARRYLFRLYASSKEGTQASVGRFGVGFWSILRFEPTHFRIESGDGRERWAVECSGDLSGIERVPAAGVETGTRIVLRRDRDDEDEGLAERVEQRLSHYCRYLRRAGRRRRPLPVYFEGRAINEAMTLDGPVTLSFSSREAEGVVGLGKEPRVELYARGLWVTTVSVLEELEPNSIDRRPAAPGEGLAPVVILNSDALEVVLSRDEPVDGRALRRLLKLARARVDRLVEHAIEGVAPRSHWQRLTDRVEAMVRALGGPAIAAVLAAWLVVLLGASAALYLLTRSAAPAHLLEEERAMAERVAAPAILPPVGQPYRPITGYRGATIDVPTRDASDWSLTVEREEPLYFRALVLDDYDLDNGWQQAPQRLSVEHPLFACGERCAEVEMAVGPVRGHLVIPVPTGFRLDPSSVRWNGAPVDEVFLDRAGESSVALSARGMNVLSYRIGEAYDSVTARAQSPTGARLDARWVRRLLNRARRLGPDEAVRLATQEVRERIAYDVGAQAAERFERQRGEWSQRVLRTGAGDCDVKNGLNVLLLRRLGIPARLAVGMVAIDGRARSGLHAWTEYWHEGRWRVADATGRPVTPAGGRVAVSGPEPRVSPRSVRPRGLPRRRAAAVGATRGDDSRSETLTDESIEARLAQSDRALASSLSAPDPVVEPDLEPSPPRHETLEAPPGAFLAALLAMVGALLVGWWRRRRVQESLERHGESAEQRAAVAGMVRELMRGSAGWRGISSLGRRRVLPTLSGPPLSLIEALERSRRGQLWAGHRRSLLSRSAAQKGHPVLDLEDRHFGALVKQSFDVVDLPGVESLNISPLPSALERLLGPLLADHARVACGWSRGLGDRASTEFDLTPLRLGSALPMPSRCVVLNPEHPEVRARIVLLERQPERAVFSWIDWLISQSIACERNAARLREAAAASVFIEEAA